jgi:uridylate kinase
MLEKLSYQDVFTGNLKVMDHAAISLCSESKIPIIVLNIFQRGNIIKALQGEKIGTIIS